jgi:hypothetical protein
VLKTHGLAEETLICMEVYMEVVLALAVTQLKDIVCIGVAEVVFVLFGDQTEAFRQQVQEICNG